MMRKKRKNPSRSSLVPSESVPPDTGDSPQDAQEVDLRAVARSFRALPEEERTVALVDLFDKQEVPSSPEEQEVSFLNLWRDPSIAPSTDPLERSQRISAVANGKVRQNFRRAVAFKQLAADAGVRSWGVRGFLGTSRNFGPHTWNEITLGDGRTIVIDGMRGADGVLGPRDSRVTYFGEDLAPMYWKTQKG